MASLFYLNTEVSPRCLDPLPPHTTVLEYLRQHQLLGTKEGCATGDCGACTVAVVSLEDGELAYRSLNSCITPISSLAGRLLITIDGLAGADGSLHPVQRAVTEAHGSQCGFCSPGVVMSLFTHVKNGASGEREDVIEGISGNLCRCTGYVPIIKAAQALTKEDASDHYAKAARTIRRRLAALQSGKSSSVPTTTAQLARQLAARDAPRIVAGATDLGIDITQQLATPALVNVGRIKELRGIRATASSWEVGAATSWEECDEKLSPHLPGFGELMRRFGSPQIRAQATVGGNLGTASPIADGPPVFLALGCTLILQKGARRRSVRLEDYFKGYKRTALGAGEFIRALILERPGPDAHFHVYKVSKRIEDDISSVCAAFLITLDNAGRVAAARLAYGGLAVYARRARAAEKALIGKAWDEDALAAAQGALARDFAPRDGRRASGRYKALVAANLLERFAHETRGTRVALEALAA